MQQFVVPALLMSAGVIATALVTWLVAVRQRSGKIDTTEADVLWAEGKAMREELRADLVAVREVIVLLRAELGSSQTENAMLRTDLARCSKAIANLRRKLP